MANVWLSVPSLPTRAQDAVKYPVFSARISIKWAGNYLRLSSEIAACSPARKVASFKAAIEEEVTTGHRN